MYVTDGVNVFCSLRSDKDTGVDVSKIAIKYGGGGHRASSGFRMNLEDFSKMMSVARLPKDKQ
jgi:nanoRNase/pAp phosphatase (c-di-AMP/oligoRNAs hydrolase)